MKYKPLGEICDVVSGGTPSRSKAEYWNGGTIPWIKIGNIKSKHVSQADEYITKAGLDGSSAKILPKGTLLYTIFATLGEVGILDVEACTNQAIAGITIKDSSEIISDYLYYFLMSQKKLVNDIGRGVAQNNINMSILRNFQVPLPTIIEQQHIVEVMDTVETCIDARKREIQKLDELIKARFVEMFDSGKYRTVKAADVCDFITKGTTPPTGEIILEYEAGLVPFLKVYNLSFTGELLFDAEPQYITAKIHNGKLARSKVYPNDVIMNIVGPPLGKFSLVTDEFEEWNINQAIAIFRSKNEILPRYLLAALMQPKVLKPFLQQAVGIRQLNLSLEQCRNLEFPLPPIEEQKRFVEFSAQVDKSKAAVQKSLDETQKLFDRLMQEYFG